MIPNKKSWFQGMFCCSTEKTRSCREIQVKEVIQTFEELCLKDFSQRERLKILFFNKKHHYYCDKQKRLITSHHLHEVKISNYLPVDTFDRQLLKYACPICYRYFNLVLKSQCCNNYVCHMCCLDFILKSKVDNFCYFCMTDQCRYIDVAADDKLKIYSDSQGLEIIKENDNKNETDFQLVELDFDGTVSKGTGSKSARFIPVHKIQ